MKKIIIALCTMYYVLCTIQLKSQNIEWTKTLQSLDTSGSVGIAALMVSPKDGGIYTIGKYVQSANFGNGHTLSGGNDGLFLARFDTAGNCQWAQSLSIAVTSSCQCQNCISQTVKDFDPIGIIGFDSGGNIIVYGSYCGSSIDFGNGVTANNCGYNIFIAKYNSSGQCQWAKTKQSYFAPYPSCSPYDEIICSSIDSSDNIYLSVFNYLNSTFCGMNLLNEGSYFLKINTNGIGIWNKQTSNTSSGYSFSYLEHYNKKIYASAEFIGTVSFGTYTLTPKGTTDVAVLKMDTAGNFLAAVDIGATGGRIDNDGIAISNNRLVIAAQSNTNSASAGTYTLNTGSGHDKTFIVVYDTSLSVLNAHNTANDNNGQGYSLLCDDNKGNMYLRISNTGTTTFGTLIVSTTGQHVTKIDNALNYYWDIDINSNDIAPDTLGNLYVSYYPQLTKIKNAYALGGIGSRQLQTNQLQVYPNPSSSIFNLKLGTTIKNTNTINIYLYDVSGKELNALPYTRQDIYTLQIDLSNYSQGNYLLKAEIDGVWYSAKLER